MDPEVRKILDQASGFLNEDGLKKLVKEIQIAETRTETMHLEDNIVTNTYTRKPLRPILVNTRLLTSNAPAAISKTTNFADI